MTLKEKVKETKNIDAVHSVFCPSDFDFLNLNNESCPTNSRGILTCSECWNREYKEPANE